MSTTSRAPARKDTREIAMEIPMTLPVPEMFTPVGMQEDSLEEIHAR